MKIDNKQLIIIIICAIVFLIVVINVSMSLRINNSNARKLQQVIDSISNVSVVNKKKIDSLNVLVYIQKDSINIYKFKLNNISNDIEIFRYNNMSNDSVVTTFEDYISKYKLMGY